MHVWSKLSSAKWVDAWEERFYGNPNAVIEEIRGKKSIRLTVYCETEKEAMDLKEYWGGAVRELKNQNWAAINPPERKPLKIRDKLVVLGETGAELEDRRQEYADRVVLSFPSEMAFGTGDHETTSTVLRYLIDEAQRLNRSKKAWDAVDLGCGTGILGIAAQHLGANDVYGCDFDSKAVEVAISAAIRNLVPQVTFEEQDVLLWESPKKYDLVMANLFSTILQKAFVRMRRWIHDDGVLLVSGILFDQWEETCLAGEKAGFHFTEWKRKGKWVSARAIPIKD